jgi:hypothetical protein
MNGKEKKKMKNALVFLAVLLLSIPAIAADWSFYGSARVSTFYVDQDYGDSQVNGQNDDQVTQWFFQGNSRLGAKVKADKVSGRVELALGKGGDGGDTAVTTRLAYGQWQFSDTASLKVGKDYSPVTDSNMSNQVFDSDNNMEGTGHFHGRRPAYIGLYVGNFEFAAITPIYGNNVGTTATGINGATGGDPDAYLPKLEAAYNFKYNAGYIRPKAGFQWYQVEENGLGNVTKDLDVYAYVLGVSSQVNVGAFYINAEVAWGANWSSPNWKSGTNAATSSLPYLSPGGDDIRDVYSWSGMLVGGWRLSDTLKFEAGGGPRVDNAKNAPGPSQKDGSWIAYAQAVITLAPGVNIVPEAGYYDYMDDVAGNDQGYQWYAGAKWQIDF